MLRLSRAAPVRAALSALLTLLFLLLHSPALQAAELIDVAALRANPVIKRAFREIESQREFNMRRLIELTEIAAPPFQEARRAEVFLADLQAAGLKDAYIDSVAVSYTHLTLPTKA